MPAATSATVGNATVATLWPQGDEDKQRAALVTSPTQGGFTTTESGGTATFQLVLGTAPTAAVNVSVTSSNTSEGVVTSPASGVVSFTTANWSTPQTVVFSGVNDLIADGDQQYYAVVSPSSSDVNYNGYSANLFLITNRDVDHAAIQVNAGGLTTTQLGNATTFTVQLTSKPKANVVLPVISSQPTRGTVSPATLTFTAANYTTPQTVTVTGQLNFLDAPTNGGAGYYVQLGQAVSSDTFYASLPAVLLLTTNLNSLANRVSIVDTTIADSTASFKRPRGMAFDSGGSLYVSDTGNSTIRKIDQWGNVTTFAGSPGLDGFADGTGSNARFNRPRGIAIDKNNNLYVSDTVNQTIRKITSAGVVTTIAGITGSAGFLDGAALSSRFEFPRGIAVDGAGNVFVADSGNDRIRKIAGGVVSTFASGLMKARDVAFDANGNLLVAAMGADRIYSITPAGVVSVFAGSGTEGTVDGAALTAQFSKPRGLAVDSQNNVFVSEAKGATIRKIANGVVTTLAGGLGALGKVDAVGTTARFAYTRGIAVDSLDNVFVADTVNHLIRRVSSGGATTTFAGTTAGSANSTSLLSGDGAQGVVVDTSGNMFVSDSKGGRIIKITYNGAKSVFATGLNNPRGLAIDSGNNIYVACYSSGGLVKITPAGVQSTLATGAIGGPVAVAVDGAGNIYTSDRDHDTIFKITSGGAVSTFAGGSAGTTDGTGTGVAFQHPAGLAVFGSNLYVADTDNSTIRVLTLSSATSLTLAGKAGVAAGADGSGTNARFQYPTGISVDASGNLFVADTLNHAIRKVTPGGVVTTVVGILGYSGTVAQRLPTTLHSPSDVFNYNNVLFITSSLDNALVTAQQNTAW